MGRRRAVAGEPAAATAGGAGEPTAEATGGGGTPAAAATGPVTEWVYDLRGFDLTAWAARAGAELGALTGPNDSVLLLIGDADATPLAAALAQAGYPARAITVEGIAALVCEPSPAVPAAPPPSP